MSSPLRAGDLLRKENDRQNQKGACEQSSLHHFATGEGVKSFTLSDLLFGAEGCADGVSNPVQNRDLPKQDLGRDAEPAMKGADHADAQRAFSVEDF